MRIFFILLVCVLGSCAPHSPERLQKKSHKLQKELIHTLRKVETKADLRKQGPAIRELCQELVTLNIQADSYYKKTKRCPPTDNGHFSELLEREVRRIHRIEGCGALLEKYQREALIRLHTYAEKPH